MANHEMITAVLSSGLSLLGLAALLWLYRDYRKDLFRARLFALRGELFDGGASGLVPFDHPAYGLLRSTLNGFLRSGHRLGTAWLIAMALAGDPPEDYDRKWRESTQALTPEQTAWLRNLREEMHRAFLAHLLVTSLFGCLLFFWVGGRHGTVRIDSVALANASGTLPQAA